MLDLEKSPGRGGVPGEGRVAAVALQERLDLSALACLHGVELGHDLAAAHDPEVLAAVLDGVEEVGEVPGRVGSAHFRHQIRLSDWTAQNPADVAPNVLAASGTIGAHVRLDIDHSSDPRQQERSVARLGSGRR